MCAPYLVFSCFCRNYYFKQRIPQCNLEQGLEVSENDFFPCQAFNFRYCHFELFSFDKTVANLLSQISIAQVFESLLYKS